MVLYLISIIINNLYKLCFSSMQKQRLCRFIIIEKKNMFLTTFPFIFFQHGAKWLLVPILPETLG